MKNLALFVTLLLFTSFIGVFGSEDYYLQPLEVSSQFEGNVSTYVKVDVKGNLEEVKLKWGNVEFSVPKSEFENIPYPNLSSVRVLGGGGFNSGAYRYISFSFGKKFCNSIDKCTMGVGFIFGKSGYKQRIISKIINDSEADYESQLYFKNPNEEEYPAGRIQSLGSVTDEH